MKDQVTAIIESFEDGDMPESDAVAQLQALTGRVVDADWLRNYWSSESLEDFVDRLCAESIADWRQISDDQALKLIAEYIQTESRGRQDSIEEALDRRFGKPTGTLSNLVRMRDLSEPSEILGELKKDTRIYL
jgi:hypothetical protein